MRSLLTRAAALAASVVAVASLTACTGSARAEPAAKPSAQASAPPPCQDSIAEGCQEIVVGGRTYRYYVSPPKSGATGEALLVDLGGPGISLGSILPPDYGSAFRKDLGAVADGKTLLLVEEPWVSGDADDTCRQTSAQFYSWIRRNWRTPSAAGAPTMTCPWGQGVYGWNKDTYRSVVSAVTAKQKLTSLDMAAISFGAVRYSYIDDLIGTATLVRPAAAPGTPSRDVIAARTAQVWKSLTTKCAGCTAGTVRKITTKTISRYAGSSADLADRSVPFTDFDVASGLVAAGISTAAQPALGWTAGQARVDPKTTAQLSDALWMRIGQESVSPALVAYADEYCQAYPGGTGAAGGDPIRTILGAPTLCTGNPARPAKTPRPVDCLLVGSDDASAPAALARTWRVADGGTTAISRVRRHWFNDMAKCKKAVER